MMSGGFLMFPKIVSETGNCFTKASILSNSYGLLTVCKQTVRPSGGTIRQNAEPLAGVRPSTTVKK